MTFSRNVVVVFLLAFALDPLQALRLSQSPQLHNEPDLQFATAQDFTHTELVSKYGIMFSMDIHPHHPSSDTRTLSPNDFTSVTLESWNDGAELSKSLHVWKNESSPSGKQLGSLQTSIVEPLLMHSRMHGTTTICHSMYIDEINTQRETHPMVYVISSALPAFIRSVLPKINRAFVLVTGDSVLQTPGHLFKNDMEMQDFIDNPLLLHWFAQNGHLDHTKFTRIPNGLDYHTLAMKIHPGQVRPKWGPHMSPQEQENMLKRIRDNAANFNQRKSKVLVSFSDRKGRSAVRSHFKKSKIAAFSQSPDREQYWKEVASIKYVASPPGAGWDCHRTWEALALGSVPIVESTGIDKLFLDNKLPVSIISHWGDVENLEEDELAKRFGEWTGNMPPAMTLQYWVDMIKSRTNR